MSETTQTTPCGPASRRGPFRVGERVRLQNAQGRAYTVTLTEKGWFNVNKASFPLGDLIGAPEGTVVTSREGREFVAMRPRLQDYSLQMPRGATIIYPKDTGQIIGLADIFEGARVLEAGAGSGAMSMALLAAVGVNGHLTSVELREEFADIAAANVELWFGGAHPAWELIVDDLAQRARTLPRGYYDRCVLDMLAPWEHLQAVADLLAPGGVLVAYVATVTQMSRLVEDLRLTERFSEPESWETIQRAWHVEGLAVRPEHSMVGHTGFLVMARTLAPGCRPPRKKTRPQKAAEGKAGQWDDTEGWSESDAGQKPISAKKLRRVRRDAVARRGRWSSGMAGEDPTPLAASPRSTYDKEGETTKEDL